MVDRNRSGGRDDRRPARRPLKPLYKDDPLEDRRPSRDQGDPDDDHYDRRSSRRKARDERRAPRRDRDDRDDDRRSPTRREARRDDDRRAPRRDDRRPSGKRTSAPRREYWSPTADSTRQQMTRSRSRFDTPVKGDQFKAKQGDNTVRILPPTWPDPRHYCLEVWEHRYVGPDESHYLCPRKMKNEACCICDAECAARDEGDLDESKRYKPMQRWVCYVLHRDNEDKNVRTKPLIWDMNGFQDEEIVDRTYDKKSNGAIPVTNPDIGYDLSFRRTGAKERTRYVGFDFDRDPSPISDDPDVTDEILSFIEENPINKMLKFRDNEFLEKMLYGTSEAPDEDLDDTTDEPVDETDDAGEEPPYDEDAAPEEDDAPPEDEAEAPPEEDEAPPEDEEVPTEDDEPEPEVRPARRQLAARDGKGGKAPPREDRRPSSRPSARPAPRQQRRPASTYRD